MVLKFLVFMVLACSIVLTSSWSESHDSHDWDIFTFTQEWPVAVCVQGREEHHSCKIPTDIHGWGVHGLWPTKSGTEGPSECNGSYPFDTSALQDLIPQLRIEWPNLYTDTSMTSFWEHEWTKHGTCATSLAATGDIHKYFSKALQLKSRYDATKLLSNQGINPDNKTTYPIDAVEAAMKRELSANALVMCAYDEKTKQQLMYEVEICLNKDFNPVDCYPDTDENSSGKRHSSHHKYPHKPTSNCPHKYGFYYLPIPGMYTVDKHTGFKRDSEMHFKDLDYYLRRWKLIKDKLVSNMEESNNESY